MSSDFSPFPQGPPIIIRDDPPGSDKSPVPDPATDEDGS